ncbi:MAG: hypothetical protein ACFFDU_00825 [Candidatus Thorarchaeota archaeon]
MEYQDWNTRMDYTLKMFSGIILLMHLVVGIATIYVALADLIIRESITFIAHSSMVTAIDVLHIHVILHSYHPRGYLPFLSILAFMLETLSLVFMHPYGITAHTIVPGADSSVDTCLFSCKNARP